MSCPAPDRILGYVARRLPVDARDALDTHVDECEACRLLLGELARTALDDVIERGIAPEPLRIGRYQIEARLGEGGMGTVFAAYDPELDRRLAVKLVHPELAQRGGLERLLREGRALARLSHPNVVAVYDAGTDGDQVYVAMELVEGETLAAWLRARPRSWRDIAAKFAAAGRGIAAAHRAGIVHRDVKPENVLIDRDGRPRVVDFGLAGLGERTALPVGAGRADPRDAARGGDARLTRPGTVMGTPKFMSPEQWEATDVGPASDQYSLSAALASALFDDTPDRPIPRWLRRALARGRADEPAARFASIDALIDAIDPARHDARNRRIAGALGGAALLGALGLAYVAMRAPDAAEAACTAAAAERSGLWTPIDRATVAAALLETGARDAAATWQRVDAAVSVHSKTLAIAEAGLCAQQPRSAEAREAFALGLACLDERRSELAALTERLRRLAPAELRLGVSLVHELSPVEDCANPRMLTAEHAAYATPAGAVARTAIAMAMREARVASDAMRSNEAAAHAHHAVALAEPFGGTILAKALLLEAETAVSTEGFAACEAHARAAAALADAAHADELRAHALAVLINAIARAPGREKEALAMVPLVEAAIDRVGKRTAYTPLLQHAQGVAQMRLGQTRAAIASFLASLDTARSVLPHDDPRMPEYLYLPGVAYSQLRLDEESLRYHGEAHRVAIAIWGPNHPRAARFEINFAVARAALGDCATALGELAHARAVLTGVLPADSPEHLLITELIGTCYNAQHDHARALREHLARQRVLSDAGRATSVEMAGVWLDIGDVQLDRKAYDEATASYRRALAIDEAVLGQTDARLGYPLSKIGEAELAAQRPGSASAALDRALAIYTAANVPPLVTADVWFLLARARWARPAARPASVALAIQARDAWAPAGSRTRRARRTRRRGWRRIAHRSRPARSEPATARVGPAGRPRTRRRRPSCRRTQALTIFHI